MRIPRLSLSIVSLLGVSALVTAVQGETVPDFRLLDQHGRSHILKRYVDVPAVALLAFPADATPENEALRAFAEAAKANPKGIFLGIAPGTAPEALGTLEFPVLNDVAQVILPAVGLTHAYETLLVETAHWQAVYRGDAAGLAGAIAALSAGSLSPALNSGTGAPLALAALPSGISYTKQVAPILEAQCVGCHSEGNVGPFALNSHREVASHAKMIAETLRTGRMPPWNADPRYGHFSNAMALSDADKRMLLGWIEAGAPKDGDTDPLEAVKPAAPTTWRLGTPDLIVKLPEPQNIPAEGVLDYRHYDVPLDLPPGTWLRGTEVRITSPQVVHHVLVYMHRPDQDIDFTEEYVASYVPGHDPGFFPEGTGKPVPEHAQLLFQLHYTPNGKAVTDTPELGLYLCKEKPAHEVFLGSAVNRHFEVEANAHEAEVSAVFRAPEDVLVYSLAPHMHLRGRRMSFEAIYPGGQREMLLSVPDYDFYWQHSYHLAEPKRIPKGTVIQVTGAFDNSVRNPLNPDPSKPLQWGEQSWEEMFIGSILYRNAD